MHRGDSFPFTSFPPSSRQDEQRFVELGGEVRDGGEGLWAAEAASLSHGSVYGSCDLNELLGYGPMFQLIARKVGGINGRVV